MKGPILCFVGPPGVGKTSLGQSIARAMNRKFVRISLGGVRDEAEIRGHRRTYIGAIPGRIVQALKQAGAMNPVFMLDEIDKIAAGYPGRSGGGAARGARPGAEPLVPRSLPRDHRRPVARAVHRDANQLGTIHPALLDRMEIISLAGYTEEEKLHIARRYLIPRQLDGARPDADAGRRSTDDALRRIIARVHARGRRPQPRAADRRRRAQGRGAGRRAGRPRPVGRRSSTADERRRLSRAAALPRRGRVPRLAAGRRDRRGVDRNRRRRAVHRGEPAAGRTRQHDSHRPARQRDAGVGARGAQPHPRAARGARHRRRTSSTSTICTSTCRPARSRRTVRRPA